MKTGKVIVGWLNLVNKDTMNPITDSSGNPITKPNIPTDPYYIPPYFDSSICGDVAPGPTTTVDPCNNIITFMQMDCSSPVINTLNVQLSFTATDIIKLEVRKNNILVFSSGDVQTVAGNSYFGIPKSITGDVTFRFFVRGCTREFFYTILCVPVTTTTPPVTTTQAPVSTTQAPVTTTVPQPVTALFSMGPVICDTEPTTTSAACLKVFQLVVLDNCDVYRAYSVQVNTISGGSSGVEYGWSLTNDASTVSNWSSSSVMSLIGTGVTRYIFVKYGVSCTEMIGSTNKNCPIITTTVAPTTTQAPTTTAVPTTTIAPPTTLAPTTTAGPTTTAAPCAGPVTITSVTPVDNNTINVNITTGLTEVYWKLYIGTTLLAGNVITVTSNPNTIELTTYNMISGQPYKLYMFGAGCPDGVSTDFTYCSRPATTANTGTYSWGVLEFTSLADIQDFVNNYDAEAKGGQDRYYENMNVGGKVFASSTGCTAAPDAWYYIHETPQTAIIPFACGHYAIHIVAGVIVSKTLVSC